MLLSEPSARHALFAASLSALLVHYIFNRYEPQQARIHITLLVLVPASLFALFLGRLPVVNAALVTFTAYWATLATLVALYRLSPWHPLSRQPGPLFLRLSKLSMAWVSRGGKRHLYTQELHRRYGDVVRVGVDQQPSAIQTLLGTAGLHKGPQWDGRVATQSVAPLIAIKDPKEHLRRRKPWNRALSVASVKDFEPFVTHRAQQLLKVLPEQHGPVNLAQWFSWFTYDLMSDMAFGGGSSEMMLNGDDGSVWPLLEVGLVNSDTFGHLPWLADYTRSIPFLGAKMKQMRAYCIDRTQQRVMLGSTTRKDLFYYLNNEDGAEPTPPLPEVVADGTLAIVAGADTTSSVLSSVFFCLLSHPESYSRLRAEVDRYYPRGEDPFNPRHHGDMPYLNAAINEAMRLFPPISDGSQRVVPAGSGGRVVGNDFLPEGTVSTVHTYTIQRDPRNFSPLPDEFWPERWIHAASGEPSPLGGKLIHNAAAFFPFSFGPANCAGKGLALLEMRMVVCAVVQKLELAFVDGFEPSAYEDALRDYFILTRPPLPVVVRER
ncbi:high nitrogen upregulated cytochrome P450 monooxygenase 2 [Epithele typhae]|uniref:high nitrogen upregulated cytochrome P450 monooxygenase 2 n=1 Tax=Epithele typhae TaxID=378194 RepID=UPI0020073F9A|nr:high nitrogen upregulated cytochrome P450 monooxygenase 2 [Epithele typhae]KAH9932046.1 high nitrogen upregulated cytochrome P450 monooxygenase 2 [Epithele typhae]